MSGRLLELYRKGLEIILIRLNSQRMTPDLYVELLKSMA